MSLEEGELAESYQIKGKFAMLPHVRCAVLRRPDG